MGKGQARVGIVGAGISGLATAYYLDQAARAYGTELRISLLERSARSGGVIETERFGDFLLEWGPENFVAFRPLILELIGELGLSSQLIGSNDEERQTYVLNDGRLEPLPEGMAFLAPVSIRSFWATELISFSGKLRACLEPFVPPSKNDLSAYEFLRRRLGRELTEKVAEPLVSAIYGGDTRKLSLASALPETHILEQKYGSLWRGMRATRGRRSSGGAQPFFRSLRDGMSELVTAMIDGLNEIEFRFGADVRSVQRMGEAYRLVHDSGEEEFDALVLAVPATAAGRILRSLSEAAAAELEDVEYTSTWIVYLAYDREEFSHPLNGFGFVAPAREARVLDACTWVSTKFNGRCPDDSVLLRAAIHNGRQERNISSESETVDEVHSELKRILNISCQPTFGKMRPALGGMAQPHVHHRQRLVKVEDKLAALPGVFLCGAYTSGVGIPSCVSAGQSAATKVHDFLRS